jgi:NAD(P)H-hydrate epimerase
MIPVLDNAGMREADRVTIDELGVPSLVLMELAAASVTDVVLERFGGSPRVLVACGPGNNGGDGLAVARQLRCRGCEVEAALLARPASLKGDPARQLAMARAFGVPLNDCAGDLGRLQELLAGCDVVVDALFGTGLDRPLADRWLAAIQVLDASGRPIVAVDLPSGLSGSSAAVSGECVHALVTVTFGAPKVAHALPPACRCCGDVAVGDIGIPPWVLETQSRLALVEADDVGAWLPPRSADAHKGHFGHLGVVAGRVGRAGAAALAARAAVTMGAGLVTVATASGAVAPIQAAVPEAMVDPLPQGRDGAASGDGLAPLLARATALAVGPGLGTGQGPRRLLERILAEWSGPLLLDADALTLLGTDLERLAGRRAPTVLTPHPGELARLLGRDTAEIAADRLGAAREAAARSGAIVLAKGARTVVAVPDDRALVNPTGSPGLASGGAGDVLTGAIGALLAQALPGREAAAAGAWLHGRAAELAGEALPGAVPASVVIDHLPAAERELRDEE